MARELTRILDDLRRKIASLASQRDQARRDNVILTERVATLSDQLEKCRADLALARMEADFLTVSHHAVTPDKLISARRRVQRLIAKIDRCIVLIKDDADID